MGRMSNRWIVTLDLHAARRLLATATTPRGHARAAADFILERDLGPVHCPEVRWVALSVQLAASTGPCAIGDADFSRVAGRGTPRREYPSPGDLGSWDRGAVVLFGEMTSPQERV